MDASIVGRDAVLDRAWRALGPAASLLVHGPPGIGKTALWRALLAQAERTGWLVLACAPTEPEAGLPFAALADLLRPLAARVADLPRPQRVAAEVVLLSSDSDEVVDERAIGAATRSLLEAAVADAAGTPVLVAVDDAPWLDPPSERALRFASTTGAIDPAALYERVAALGNRAPGPWDLTQALLRLPAGDDRLAGQAEALRTPAGDRLAAWLRAGGLPSPTFRAVTVPRRERRIGYDPDYDRMPMQRVQVEVTPPDGFDDPLGLLTVTPAPIGTSYGSWAILWPAVLPGYRGLVAAHALPDVAGSADMGLRHGTAVLPLLAECTGDGSVALDVALAYGLGARHDADRIAALDALLMLAGAGSLDASAVGWHIGALGANGLLTLTRVIDPLRDAVAAGARLTIWRMLAAALPALVALPTPPRGTPDLLTLAAETATATAVRIDIAGLTDVATRSASSRLVVEARRLAKALDQ